MYLLLKKLKYEVSLLQVHLNIEFLVDWKNEKTNIKTILMIRVIFHSAISIKCGVNATEF